MRKLLTALVSNSVLANVVLVTIVVLGMIAAFTMVREDMPEISLDEIEVRIALPGADPAEVETGISRRVEAAVEQRRLKLCVGVGTRHHLRDHPFTGTFHLPQSRNDTCFDDTRFAAA